MELTEHQRMLFQAVSDLPPELVAQAQNPPSRGRVWYRRAAVVAAALILVVAVWALVERFGSEDGAQSPAPLFAITVMAENGEYGKLELNQGFFNSSSESGDALFQTDMPTFAFFVSPSEWNPQKDDSTRYGIELSYNQKKLEGIGDDHVQVLFAVAKPGSGNPPFQYIIMGWFPEPTDLVITFRDSQSGEIVEKLTVNVAYHEETQGYQLTLTEAYHTQNLTQLTH